MISELMLAHPKLSIIIIGLIVSFCITLLTLFVTDVAKMKYMKQRQKDLQAEMKKHKDNPEKLAELNKEILKHTMEMMKHSFKPTLISFLPIIILFKWLHGLYDPVVGGWWLGYYIGASIVGSIAFRKLLKLD